MTNSRIVRKISRVFFFKFVSCALYEVCIDCGAELVVEIKRNVCTCDSQRFWEHII